MALKINPIRKDDYRGLSLGELVNGKVYRAFEPTPDDKDAIFLVATTSGYPRDRVSLVTPGTYLSAISPSTKGFLVRIDPKGIALIYDGLLDSARHADMRFVEIDVEVTPSELA